MSVSRALILLLAGAGIVLAYHYYPQLPDVVASHFDGQGTPNDYTSRDGVFVVFGVLYAGTLLVFLGLGPLFGHLPTRWFNMPHREYYLAAERREDTLRFMTTRLEWFGVATMLLLLVTFKLAFEANLEKDAHLDNASMLWALGAYFLYTTIWLARFLMKFRKPKET